MQDIVMPYLFTLTLAAVTDCAGWIMIALGAFLMLTGAVGIIRMPDMFTRLHPAGIADSLGAPLLLGGLMMLEGFTLTSGKLFLLILFLFITGPTSTHALAKAAILSGETPLENTKKT